MTARPITRADLERLGCRLIYRDRRACTHSVAGVKDAAGKWIGYVDNDGAFQRNHTALNGYKPKFRVKAVSV
jgi:hypothetical protein